MVLEKIKAEVALGRVDGWGGVTCVSVDFTMSNNNSVDVTDEVDATSRLTTVIDAPSCIALS